jgi:chloramphenicol O-acetyltransferase type A
LSSPYKEIDVSTWARRSAFEFFKDFEDPFFNITANLDVTELRRFCRENELSYALSALFYSQLTVNSIRELRLRLLEGKIVEFESVESTQTILNEDETFSFCYFEARPTVDLFVAKGKIAIENYKGLKTFDVETERLDLIYHSSIPWVSFTSFKHASRLNNQQSVPRIVFGKVFADGESEKMPVSIEVNHSLVDGVHVGKYFTGFQQLVNAL